MSVTEDTSCLCIQLILDKLDGGFRYFPRIDGLLRFRCIIYLTDGQTSMDIILLLEHKVCFKRAVDGFSDIYEWTLIIENILLCFIVENHVEQVTL